VLKYAFIFLIFFSKVALSCGEKPEYNPEMSLGKYKDGDLFSQVVLHVPKNVGVDEIVAIHFQVGEDKTLALPISYYASGEYPDLHKDGFVTVMYLATLENIKKITAIVHYLARFRFATHFSQTLSAP
jgi:beta-xylosidase